MQFIDNQKFRCLNTVTKLNRKKKVKCIIQSSILEAQGSWFAERVVLRAASSVGGLEVCVLVGGTSACSGPVTSSFVEMLEYM